MKFQKNWFDKKWVAYTIATCSAVLLYVILLHLPVIGGVLEKIFDFIFPVFAGLLIAYLLDPIVGFFQKHLFRKIKSEKLGRNLSIFMTLIVVGGAIALFFVTIVPPIVRSIVNLVLNMNQYILTLENMIANLASLSDRINLDLTKINEVLDNVTSIVQNFFTENIQSILMTSVSIGTHIFTTVIACIIAIYFLADKVRLKAGAKRFYRLFVNQKHYDATRVFVKRCNHIIYSYVGFDIVDALIVGAANAVFMKIVGMPFVVLVSTLVGIFNLAPTFGPIIGAVIGAIILVLVNPWHALFFLIFTIVIQAIDGYMIKPKLFGDVLGVPAVWILICIIVGGRMFGVAGIMLAIPLAAISDFVYREVICVKLESRRRKLDKQQDKKKEDPEEEV